MNTQIVAVLISEGTKLVGQLLRQRPIRIETKQVASIQQKTPPPSSEDKELPAKYSVKTEQKATQVSTGCIPCAIGHLGTCSGLLNEAMRFARSEGIDSDEVIDRVGKCLDELNAMERVDLTPEMIVSLPAWEKQLAEDVLVASRATRHALEDYNSIDAIEQTAATTQSTRTTIWRNWIKKKMQNLTPEEQKNIQQKVIEKLDELTEEESDES